jgi:hypothetical protein
MYKMVSCLLPKPQPFSNLLPLRTYTCTLFTHCNPSTIDSDLSKACI